MHRTFKLKNMIYQCQMKGAAFLDIVFYRLANYQGVGKSLGCGSMDKFMLMKVMTDPVVM